MSRARQPATSYPIEVVWEAPPQRATPSIYADALAEVKANPGRWARLRITQTSGGAYSSRKSAANATNGDDRFEFKAAALGDDEGRFGVFARYRTDEQMRAAKK